MMRWLPYAFLIFFFARCTDSDHLGYTRLVDSLHYRFEVLGEESKSVAEAEDAYVSFTVRLIDEEGKVAARKKVHRVSVKRLSEQGRGLDLALQQMHLNDSTSFKGRAVEMELAGAFPGMELDADSVLSFTVTVDELLSDEEYRGIRAVERSLKDQEMSEMKTLSMVLDSLNIDPSAEISGVYYKSLKSGKGGKPVSGATVWVNYIGRFPSGKVFDNTYEGKLALEYQIGKPDQVIPGFAIGISQMREGGKALFIIPSTLGFGEDGSSSGIVPPFSTLIYEVSLVRVRA